MGKLIQRHTRVGVCTEELTKERTAEINGNKFRCEGGMCVGLFWSCRQGHSSPKQLGHLTPKFQGFVDPAVVGVLRSWDGRCSRSLKHFLAEFEIVIQHSHPLEMAGDIGIGITSSYIVAIPLPSTHMHIILLLVYRVSDGMLQMTEIKQYPVSPRICIKGRVLCLVPSTSVVL